MHSQKVHPLHPIQDGFPPIVLSQPRHGYRTSLIGRREDTVLDEGAPVHQVLDAFDVGPECARAY
jgi:hypothetical protein